MNGSNVILSSAELYESATGRWSTTGSLGTARESTRRRCCPPARSGGGRNGVARIAT